MGSYWDRQAYEAKKNSATATTSSLTPEAPISFSGMSQLGGGVPSAGFNQASYAAQQKSVAAADTGKGKPKKPKSPKKYSNVFPDGEKIPRDPNTLNKKGLKKYTSAKLGIKSTYTPPTNAEKSVANSNVGRMKTPAKTAFKGKASLIIKKVN
jgi:hypothetical protein